MVPKAKFSVDLSTVQRSTVQIPAWRYHAHSLHVADSDYCLIADVMAIQ